MAVQALAKEDVKEPRALEALVPGMLSAAVVGTHPEQLALHPEDAAGTSAATGLGS